MKPDYIGGYLLLKQRALTGIGALMQWGCLIVLELRIGTNTHSEKSAYYKGERLLKGGHLIKSLWHFIISAFLLWKPFYFSGFDLFQRSLFSTLQIEKQFFQSGCVCVGGGGGGEIQIIQNLLIR